MTLTPLRPAGPNERRCITRQVLGYYRALIVGGIYCRAAVADQNDLRPLLIKALKHCIAVHPILSAVIVDEETESPKFMKPAVLDLSNHIKLLESDRSIPEHERNRAIKHTLIASHDEAFPASNQIPPWKIVVLPLSNKEYLILFAYNHSHGDGKSGLAFAKTFLQGLNLAEEPSCPYNADQQCLTNPGQLLPTIEQAGGLKISWSYLLSPVLGAYLPAFIAGPLGLRASAVPEHKGSWLGDPVMRYDAGGHYSGVELMSIDNDQVQKVLTQCRRRGVRLTGLIHQMTVRALSECVPEDAPAESFVSQSAVDLRSVIPGIGSTDMALCATGYFEVFPRTTSEHWTEWTEPSAGLDHPVWKAAKQTTEGLAAQGSTLYNQPIGLLKYLPNFRKWTEGHLGKQREASYELSNLLVFDPELKTDEPSDLQDSSLENKGQELWQIESMVFSQPANATGGCLNINVVTMKEGDMTITLSWQRDVLGVKNEDHVAAQLCQHLAGSFKELASAA